MAEKKLNGTVIVTYRCNARCTMCNRYKAPSKPEEELSIETIKKLPPMYFTNITGGEPFIREDLRDIVAELRKKSDRIVISTNGYFTDRIIDLCKEFPDIGIRISIEGLEETNNEIRGLDNGFQRGYSTLKKLKKMGMKDVGFGMTVQDKNAKDLVPLYEISNKLDMEFATATLHNSFYFVENKNIIHDRPMVAKNFEKLINRLLQSKSPKKWMRAYFNHGLINYIYGQKRLLPCDMSFDTFFIDPYGDVMPCNGTKDKEVMGNLNTQTWDEIWNGPQAEEVRKKVRNCDRQCWMIGSVSPAMHKYIWKPGWWVFTHKVRSLFTKHPYSMYENKIVRDYHDGKVTKEELDKCSTCELCADANDGLSEKSKAQLKEKSGEEIVSGDIDEQIKNDIQKGEKHKLSELQSAEYEILKEFIKICDKLNLRYYMVAGTMLGAYRDHGFIPWDDDIDVAMPRKDYDTFLKQAKKYLDSKYYLSTPEDDGHLVIVTQIVSKEQKYLLNNAGNKVKTGPWIDIMVVDGVPAPGIKRTYHWYKYLFLRALYQMSHFSDIVNVNRQRPVFEKIIIKFAAITHIENVLNSTKIAYSIDKHLRKIDFDSADYVATYCGIYRKKEIFPKSVYGYGKKLPFEDIKVVGVSKPVEYLKQLYGNFMYPPKRKEDRNRHNVTTAENK